MADHITEYCDFFTATNLEWKNPWHPLASAPTGICNTIIGDKVVGEDVNNSL
jgi:hypothetical protein